MEFLDSEGVTVYVLIRMTDLERLQDSIILRGQCADFKINGRVVRIGLKPETDVFKIEEGEN